MEEAIGELRQGFEHIWNALGKALISGIDTFKVEVTDAEDEAKEKVTNITKKKK